MRAHAQEPIPPSTGPTILDVFPADAANYGGKAEAMTRTTACKPTHEMRQGPTKSTPAKRMRNFRAQRAGIPPHVALE